jgi:NAD(P)-dependent dehydrogenase (short-subunit alcohol dehydrogenase family)
MVETKDARSQISGLSAIVTGSTKGIGRAIAESLVRAGCNVAVSSRHADDAEETARALSKLGPGRAIGRSCDVQDYGQCADMVAETVLAFGRLDILVNNAGIGIFGKAGDLTPTQWRSVIGTNLDGLYFCTHAALPHLRKANGAWILNIASLAGKNPFAGGAAYNASKFGVVGFSEALMMDVRQDNIRVSYIMPGSVATHFNDHTPNEQDAWKIQPEDVAQIVMDLLAMPPRTLPSRVEVRPSKPPAK